MCSQYLVHHSFHSQTTSSGILDHEEARRKNVGGKLLGYVYWVPACIPPFIHMHMLASLFSSLSANVIVLNYHNEMYEGKSLAGSNFSRRWIWCIYTGRKDWWMGDVRMACGRGACYDGLSRTQLRPGEGWQPDPQCPAGADGSSFFPAAATAGSQPTFRPPKPAEQKGARLPELAELRVGRKERRLYQQAPAASGRANMKVAVE
jgi:hypothetical protein